MAVYYETGEEDVFPYLDGAGVHEIIILLEKLERTSLMKLTYALSIVFLYQKPRYYVPIERAAKIIKESLDDDFQFGQENKWLFKCFFLKRKSQLEFYPSHRPEHYPEDTWGWIQRQIFILRYKDKFWVFPPKP